MMKTIPTSWVVTRSILLVIFSLCSNLSLATPVLGPDAYQISEDDTLNIAAPGVLANDGGTGAVIVSNVILSAPDVLSTTAGGASYLLGTDGSFQYVAQDTFEFLAAGEVFVDQLFGATVQYVAKDAIGLGPVNKIVVTILGQNDAPTDLVLSNATLPENSPSNQVVGQLSNSDVDTSDTHVYSLVSGAGDTHNVLFNLFGVNLRAAGNLDFEDLSSYSIRIRTSDDHGGQLEKSFVISLLDLNDNAPVITSSALVEVNENQLAVITVTSFDADSVGPSPTYSLSGGGDQGAFNIDAATGALRFNLAPDFEAPIDANTDNVYQVQVSVSDGVASSSQHIDVVVLPVNDNKPQITLDGTSLQSDGIVYNEDQHVGVSGAILIPLAGLFSDLDIDSDGFIDAITIDDQDSLQFEVTSSDVSVVQVLVENNSLKLFSDADAHGLASIVITATDSAAPAANISSVPLSFSVTVNSVNDAPVYLVGSYEDLTVVEDSGDITIDLSGSFVDRDLVDANPQDEQLTYRITIRDQPNEFILTDIISDAGLNIIGDSQEGITRVLVIETTASSITLDVLGDAHGVIDLTVRATDLGRPPETPLDALPLFDEASYSVNITSLADDQPIARDDHYSDFPELVILEDSEGLIFAVTDNDYPGDTPVKVISTGRVIVDSLGQSQAWRTTSRLADPNNTGDYAIAINGEVSCGYVDCVTGQTPDTTITGSGLEPDDVIYLPRPDFNGEDSFTYCISDANPVGETAFTPPSDSRCATVTINVLPVNDKPDIDDIIVISMVQASDLVVTEEDGLKNFVRDLDNTDIDGLGCGPSDLSCTPTGDRLYFYITSALTPHGQLLSPFTNDGAFNYRPDATYFGDDEILFEVCDMPGPGIPDNCTSGIVSIQIAPLAGAPEGSTEDTVQFDYQIANAPLELSSGPEANVLVINDDSGSMKWDIMVDGNNSVYQYSTGDSVYYVNKVTSGSSSYIAPKESDAPDEGIWRLRNSTFNTVYYNPTTRYVPWEGLDANGIEFADAPPTAVRSNPLSTLRTVNLTEEISFTGRAVLNSPETCERVCRRFRRGQCVSFRNVCTGGNNGFQRINVTNFYIPRYYNWIDRNGDELLDAIPSPATSTATSEGQLVEIRSGTNYPRAESRSDCITSATSCTYVEELQNFANWFSYHRNRELTAKAALGVVVSKAENLRIGYTKTNGFASIQLVASMNQSDETGAKAELLDSIYQTNSNGNTPLRQALNRAGEYFECSQFDNAGSGDNGRCPILPPPAGNCQQNFALLITDGAWNGSTPNSTPIFDSDADNNTPFDGGAFAGIPGETLADVAMYYYERDLRSTQSNQVPTTARERALASDTAFENNSDEVTGQHMKTYTVGFGVRGNLLSNPIDFTDVFDWGDPFATSRSKIDDLRHAAYNGRGEYLDASNAADLSQKLTEAFAEFSQNSGAASAVSFNSQEIREDTLIFRAFYNTKENTGDLIAQSLSETGLVGTPVWSAAKQMDLVAANDRNIFTWDPDAAQGIPFREHTLTAAQRAVFITNASATTIDEAAEVLRKVNYLRGDSSSERPRGNFRERPIIEGRLGDIIHSTPVFVGPPDRAGRASLAFPQGTNAYSTFAAANSTRTEVIYVESNDGMLHGFKATNGDEVFGYVPSNLMLGTFSRTITNLLDFEYSHKYFVDSTPAINDAFIDSNGNGTKAWASILVGGHGAGAKAYFALDITDPNKLIESRAGEVVLWEFTEADDAYPTDNDGLPLTNADGSQRQDLQAVPRPVKDLGFSFSVPTIAMSNAVDTNGEREWIALFGNGYNSTSGIAKLFTLFIDRGRDGLWCHPDMRFNVTLSGSQPGECIGKQDFYKVDTGFGPRNGFPNGLGVPRGIDADGNGTIDYAYAGDVLGNFYRFDLTSSDPGEWSSAKIFEATYIDAFGVATPQPITTQPIVTARDSSSTNGFIVLFATGSYITVPDGRSTEIQSIYGILDRLSPELISKSALVEQTFSNALQGGTRFVRTLSDNVVDYELASTRGWYIDLDVPVIGGTAVEFPGEQAIRNFQLRGGLAFVNSIVPRSSNSCLGVAGGFALAFCPESGSTSCITGDGIFDLNNDGKFDALDRSGTDTEGNQGIVVGVRFEDAVPVDSSFIGDQRITQLSDKSLDIVGTNTAKGKNTGRLSWKQLDRVN